MATLFAIFTTIQNLAVPAATVLGAVSAFCSVVAHSPGVPARLAAFAARVGIASGRFSVVKK